jgi:hypothetical protein
MPHPFTVLLLRAAEVRESADGQIVKKLSDTQTLTTSIPEHWTRTWLASNYLALIAVFDDALEEHIAERYDEAPRKFVNRIEFLNKKGAFADYAAVVRVKDKRDSYAHDAGVLPEWSDWDEVAAAIEKELKHLGILPA